MQLPPQHSCVGGTDAGAAQALAAEQTSPVRQRLPHSPQLLGSFVVLAQPLRAAGVAGGADGAVAGAGAARAGERRGAAVAAACRSWCCRSWGRRQAGPQQMLGKLQTPTRRTGSFPSTSSCRRRSRRRWRRCRRRRCCRRRSCRCCSVSPGLQAWPQAPQWNAIGLLDRRSRGRRSRSLPPLHAEPPAQRQVAPEQLSPPGAQATPQPPQLAASACTRVQAPLAAGLVGDRTTARRSAGR